MVKFKKLSIGITIILVLFVAGIGFFYLSEFASPALPTKIHNFQVKVNDTFAIGEKHG